MIRDIRGESITETWAAEFRGLFWGEGCLFAGKYRRCIGGRWYERVDPYAVITMREDDAPLLEAIAERLGGSLRRYHYHAPGSNAQPQARWQVSGLEKLSGG